MYCPRSTLFKWLTAGLLLTLSGVAPVALGQTAIDLSSQSKNVDFSAATFTRPVKAGSSLPASCATGELFFLTPATAGKNLYICSAAGTWSAVSPALELPAIEAQAGKVLATDGASIFWQTAAAAAEGIPPYTQAFTSSSFVTLTHNLGTEDVLVACYDTGNNLIGAGIHIVDSNTVTVTFQTAQSGRCVVNGWSGTGTAGGGSTTFTGLTDAPASYTGHAQKVVRVKTDESGLEFAAIAGTGDSVQGGQGILIQDLGGGVKEINIDGASVAPYLRGSWTYDFASIANGACNQQAFSLPGTLTGFSGPVASSQALPVGVNLQLAKVIVSGTVAVEVCNLSGASYDPPALTYNVTLLTTF